MSPNTSTKPIINLLNNLTTPPTATTKQTSPKNDSAMIGTVVAAYGKRFQVELIDKKRISCVTRGKKQI